MNIQINNITLQLNTTTVGRVEIQQMTRYTILRLTPKSENHAEICNSDLQNWKSPTIAHIDQIGNFDHVTWVKLYSDREGENFITKIE